MKFTICFVLMCSWTAERSAQQSANDTLRRLQVVFRHGFRYPGTLSWNTSDTCAESYKPVDIGNLTQRGKDQMFQLGRYLRTYYSDFILPDESNVQILYSDYVRDLDSAKQVYNGLCNVSDCGATDMIKINHTEEGPLVWNKAYSTQWTQDVLSTPGYEDLCTRIRSSAGVCNKVSDLTDIADQMVAENAEECQHPPWMTLDIQDQLQSSINEVFASYKDRSKAKLMVNDSEGVLQRLYEVFNMTNASKNVYLYALHDTNIAVLLTRMGSYDGLPVPFGACLTLEEHLVNNKTVIRIFYDKTTTYTDFRPIKVFGCDWDCPYEDFVRLTSVENFLTVSRAPKTTALLSSFIFAFFSCCYLTRLSKNTFV